MTREQVKAALDRVLIWPPEAQEDALATLKEIEKELLGSVEFDTDDREALSRSAGDVENGRFALDQEARDVFSHHHRR